MKVWKFLIISLWVSGCGPQLVHSSSEALTDDGSSTGFSAAPTLAVSNPSPGLNEMITLQGNGGVPPYTYFVASGEGTLDSVNATFTTGSTTGPIMLGVTDSAGFSGYASLNVVSSGSSSQ